jgi:hypothetical protein
MRTEDTFDGGEVLLSEAEEVSAISPTATPDDAVGIDRIVLMIADPEAQLSDIMREIALLMAGVMKKMTEDRAPLDRGMVSMKDLTDQMKGYQALQKTLTDGDALSKKDALNMDGPKFKFVFKELVRLFQESMKDARVDEDLAQNCMMQFGDKLKSNDESIRRELSKIESGR